MESFYVIIGISDRYGDLRQIDLGPEGTTRIVRVEDILTHLVFTTSFRVNIAQITDGTAFTPMTTTTGTSYEDAEVIANITYCYLDQVHAYWDSGLVHSLLMDELAQDQSGWGS